MKMGTGPKGKVANSSQLWVDATLVAEQDGQADIGSTIMLDGEPVTLVAYWPRAHVYIYEVL